MSSTQNDLNTFPPLNLEQLRKYAKRWVDKIPDVPVDSITLYGYSSHYDGMRNGQSPVEYCIVFDIAGEILPDIETTDSHIEKIESFNRSIYDLLECGHTIRNQDSYLSLMDAAFPSNVYKDKDKPNENFKAEWMFLTRRLAEAEGNQGIMIRESYWELFDVKNMTETVQKMRGVPEREPAQQSNSGNFFTRESRSLWYVGFEGQANRFKHLDGIQYIAILIQKHMTAMLLQKPVTSISCRELYQAASGKTPNNVMSECAAIDEGLNIGSSQQAASDYRAKENYLAQYRKLANDLDRVEDDPEGEIVRKDIEKEMEDIISFLKERTLPDKGTAKCQNAVHRSMERAYANMRKVGMKDMAKYLQDNIKTDGAFGLSYTGTATWEITL